MRLVNTIWILVDHAGMGQDVLDGFPRGQLSREKTLHAPADEEGFFVLQVEAGQYGEIARGPVAHVSKMGVPAAKSIGIFERKSEIRG